MITEQEAVEYFRSLTYDEQRRFYGLLAHHQKSPAYTLGFPLTSRGIKLLGRAVEYCKTWNIPYRPERINTLKVKFIFEEASDRNRVLIGIMGGGKVSDDINLTCEEDEDEY